MTMRRQGRNSAPGRPAFGPAGETPRPQQGGSFTDRVMARVAEEPTPSPARAFVRSLRRLAIRDAMAALAMAWRLAFEPISPVATSARASAAALLLSVVVVIGVSGAFAASGALAFLGPDATGPSLPAPAASPAERAVVVDRSPATEPTPAPRPTAVTPGPQKAPQAKKTKRETPQPREPERDGEGGEDGRDD